MNVDVRNKIRIYYHESFNHFSLLPCGVFFFFFELPNLRYWIYCQHLQTTYSNECPWMEIVVYFIQSSVKFVPMDSVESKQPRVPWWRHPMETFSALLALCDSPSSGEFPSKRPMTRSFDVFFDLRLNKRLSKQSRRRWFERPSHLLWCHSNAANRNLYPWNLPAHLSNRDINIATERPTLGL